VSGSFELHSVGMTYGGCPVLQDVSLEISGSGLVAVVGPNGAGKSTLLGILAGLREGYQGRCLFEQRMVQKWPRRDFARRVSVVPQSLRLDFPFTAEQVVFMGRTPHAGGLFDSDSDQAAVERALRLTDAWDFRERDFRALSGGERQRVVLASALAQEPGVLLLDEPTTFLDLEHQLAIYRLLRDLAAGGMLVVCVTHDLNLAAAFASRVIALRHGLVLADAPPAEALRPDRVEEIFHVRVDKLERPGGGFWIAYGD
jgi:ABC-type cobalamin/Fe3+-siderophores transport system ATPase subunit